VLYAAKCYWPDVTETDLDARQPASDSAPYLGALLFPDDALVLCLFEAATPAAVRQATDRAGLPCERVMKTRWLFWLRAKEKAMHKSALIGSLPSRDADIGKEKRR
jgi:hypothetical protein